MRFTLLETVVGFRKLFAGPVDQLAHLSALLFELSLQLPDTSPTSWLKINPEYSQMVDRHELFAPKAVQQADEPFKSHLSFCFKV